MAMERWRITTGKESLKLFLVVSSHILRRVYDWPAKVRCPPLDQSAVKNMAVPARIPWLERLSSRSQNMVDAGWTKTNRELLHSGGRKESCKMKYVNDISDLCGSRLLHFYAVTLQWDEESGPSPGPFQKAGSFLLHTSLTTHAIHHPSTWTESKLLCAMAFWLRTSGKLQMTGI